MAAPTQAPAATVSRSEEWEAMAAAAIA